MDVGADYLRLLLQKEDSFKFESFKNCANDVKEQPLFQSDEKKVIRQDIIPVINASINGTKGKRAVGLIILRKILSQCPADVFSEYAFSWMQHCCKWSGETANEELKILRILVINSSSHPDIKKQVISSFLPHFASRLINHRSNECAKTVRLKLKCLKSIIDSYGSSCGPHSSDFKKFVIFCMKQFPEQKRVIREAAICFVRFHQWSAKRHQGIGQKESWASQLGDLIDACHTLFDSIYGCIDAVGTQPRETTGKPILDLSDILSEAPKDPVSRFHCWKVKFAILSELLQRMFRGNCSVYKSFKPSDIFSLICRLLAVNGNTLKSYSQTTDVLCLNAVLPEIHALTFDILRTLIRIAKRNLISYGSLICKLCLQSLKWTQPTMSNYGANRPFEKLRCKVYIVLSEWLSIAGSSSSIEIFADEIIPLTISNIEFSKPEMCLTSTNQSTKGKRKKREQNLSRNVDSSVAVDRTANKNTCLAAHLMLQSMIRNTYSLVKWEHHKTLQYTVISLLLPIVGLNAPIHDPLPYSDPKCRLQLFQTLYTLTKWPHWKWKKLISLSNRILNFGRNDSFEISSFCTVALAELEALNHPHGPSLAKSFLDGEKDGNSSETSTHPYTLASMFKSIDMASIGDEAPERLVLKNEISNIGNNDVHKANTLPTNKPSAQIEVSTATDVIGSSRSTDVSANVVDPHSSSESAECRKSSVTKKISDKNERRRPYAAEESINSSKKLKTQESVTEATESNPFVASMLSDFVDTLQ